MQDCADAVGFPHHNLGMLTGAGKYMGLATQISYDPAVYPQIAAEQPVMLYLTKEQGNSFLRSFEDPQNLILSLLTTCYNWGVAVLELCTQLCLS